MLIRDLKRMIKSIVWRIKIIFVLIEKLFIQINLLLLFSDFYLKEERNCHCDFIKSNIIILTNWKNQIKLSQKCRDFIKFIFFNLLKSYNFIAVRIYKEKELQNNFSKYFFE